MEMQVREVTDVVEKSKQQIEQELLDKHEAQQKLEFDDDKKEQVDSVEVSEPEIKSEESIVEEIKEDPELSELNEEQVLSFIEKRYGKQINSLEELTAEREESETLPEDVAAYFKYKKETGRSLEEYVKLQQDFSQMNPDSLLKEYLTITEEGLDPEDIESIMEDYEFDEELDDPADIKKTKLAKKKIIAKAKKFFREQQEVYKQPLESRESSASQNEEFKAYKQYVNEAKTQKEESDRKSDWFAKKSDEVFSTEFKGFKFKVDESNLTFSPGNASELWHRFALPLSS